MKTFKVITMMVMMAGCFSPISAEDEIKITIGEWAPFIGVELPHYGIVPHIVSEVFSESGVTVTYGFFPWSRSYHLVEKGTWHASAIWGRTEAREKCCYFSDVIYTGESVLFYLKDRPVKWQGDPEELNQLKGLTIGLTHGSAKTKMLEKAESRGLVTYDVGGDKLVTFQKLLAKRFDALDDIKASGLHIIRTHFTELQQEQIANTDPFEVWPYHLIFSRNADENRRYLRLFNEGLSKMKKDGRYDEMWADFYKGEYVRKE